MFHFFVLLGLNFGELGGEGDSRERWSKKLVFACLDPACKGDLSFAAAFGRETVGGLDFNFSTHLLLFSSCSRTSLSSESDERREGRDSCALSSSASDGGRDRRESEETSGKKLFFIPGLIDLEGEVGREGQNPAPMKSLLFGARFLVLGATLCFPLGSDVLLLEGLIGGDLILTTPRGRESTGDFAFLRIHTLRLHFFIQFGFLQGGHSLHLNSVD